MSPRTTATPSASRKCPSLSGRAMVRTVRPRPVQASARWPPTKPVAPVINQVDVIKVNPRKQGTYPRERMVTPRGGGYTYFLSPGSGDKEGISFLPAPPFLSDSAADCDSSIGGFLVAVISPGEGIVLAGRLAEIPGSC